MQMTKSKNRAHKIIWGALLGLGIGVFDTCAAVHKPVVVIDSDATAQELDFQWPLKSYSVTSGFGYRYGGQHPGIDLAAPRGTAVYASADGVVEYSAWEPEGYGNLVILAHPDGVRTVYAHNSRLLMRKGQFVKQGQIIARVGRTGMASGSHLHFEYRIGKQAVNPAYYINHSMVATK